jgi:hypothetical protein
MAVDVGTPSLITSSGTPDDGVWLPSLTAALDRPLSARWCVVGWIASVGLFLALVGIFLGPSNIDSQESTYSTWAIAHGDVACAYPAVIHPWEPPIAPLYPLLSSGIAAIAQIGHSVPFPSAASLGSGCSKGMEAMDHWSARSGALTPTLRIGCVCWLALMAGVIAWLRTCGRGRRLWEPATLLVVASLLPVWMAVQSFFHPQDVLALGVALLAMACARRDRWLLAGILCALAILSQQYALLVAVPLFIVAPSARKVSMLGGALVTGVIVVLPLTVMTSGHALHAIALGTGNYPYPGGTVLWETHASGADGVLLFRVAPILVSIALSWWVARRLGRGALEAVPLLALVAASLTLRLVFEVNLIAYYFLALTVSLVVLEATRGTIRRTTVAWLAILTLVICRISELPFGFTRWAAYLQNDIVPILIGGVAILAVIRQLLRGGDRRALLTWLAVAVVVLFTLIPGGNRFSAGQVVWFWQIILVVPGMLLVLQPLWQRIRPPTEPGSREEHPVSSPEPALIGGR